MGLGRAENAWPSVCCKVSLWKVSIVWETCILGEERGEVDIYWWVSLVEYAKEETWEWMSARVKLWGAQGMEMGVECMWD